MTQIRNVKVLAGCGLLTAAAVVLGFFKIPVTQIIEIRFGMLPVAVAGSWYGPGPACVIGILADIGGYLVRPTGPFFPGFTLSAALTGLICGLAFYKRPASIVRIAAASLVNTILVNLLLNTFWLAVLYGLPFTETLAARLIKEAVMLPVQIVMLAAVLAAVRHVPARSSAL